MKGFALSFLVLWAAPAFAEGPVFQHKDPVAQQEFENVYKDMRGLSVSSGTYSQLIITGQLGVGTASPLTRVHVVDDTNSATLTLDGTSRGGGVIFQKSAASSGFMGVSGAWLGSGGTDLAIGADSGKEISIYHNGGTAKAFNVSTGAEITQPLQPSFLVTNSGTQNDVTGDGTVYTVTWNNEVFDQSSDFAFNTFTAPVDGKYLFSATVRLQGGLTGHDPFELRIVTSNRTYEAVTSNNSAAAGNWDLTVTALADLDAADTATVQAVVSGSTKVVDISASATLTFFSGSLIN